jgi:hypothetical protein
LQVILFGLARKPQQHVESASDVVLPAQTGRFVSLLDGRPLRNEVEYALRTALETEPYAATKLLAGLGQFLVPAVHGRIELYLHVWKVRRHVRDELLEMVLEDGGYGIRDYQVVHPISDDGFFYGPECFVQRDPP